MFNWLKPKTVEEYLAESISLEDLERRQKLISRGEAPFQRDFTTMWREYNI